MSRSSSWPTSSGHRTYGARKTASGSCATRSGIIKTENESVLRVGGRSIGTGHPCFVIAEAGVNHNGDEEVALRLIDEAARCGADAVKFQTFDPDLLVSETAPQAEYQTRNTGAVRSQKEMLAALMLPTDAYARLARRARDWGVIFMSTPFDESSADLLESLDCPVFKLGSGEVTNHPFLSYVAAKGRPVLLSTGMSTLGEVAAAISAMGGDSGARLGLLHCVTNYPADPADCNLRAMSTMRARFGVPVGWSDHTEGSAVTLAACALGASIIEKHFTLSRDMPGPDHRSSLEPSELAALIKEIRDVEAAQGDGVKKPAQSELANARVVRRSLHARREIGSGAALSAGDVIALRPAGGLAPAALAGLIGRRLRRRVGEGEMLRPEDFD